MTTTAQVVEEMASYYDRQRQGCVRDFNDQLDWLKRDLDDTDPRRVIANIEGHLNRLRDYASRIDAAEAKVYAIRELGNAVNA